MSETEDTRSHHSPGCSSLVDSKASEKLGACYCDCGFETPWKIWEEIDGTCTIYPQGIDPDDIAFARVKPICTLPAGTPFALVRLIAAAPELLEACKEALEQTVDYMGGFEERLRAAIQKAEVAIMSGRRFMSAKFRGQCQTCKNPIAKGERVFWLGRGSGVQCSACANHVGRNSPASNEDYPCSDLGYEDSCRDACGPGL